MKWNLIVASGFCWGLMAGLFIGLLAPRETVFDAIFTQFYLFAIFLLSIMGAYFLIYGLEKK